MIAEYHPHTVRSSSVPLYMQGFPRLGDLGQEDGIDTTMFDPTGGIIDTTPPFLPPQTDIPFFSAPTVPVDPSMFDPTGGLVNTVPAVDSNTRDIANLYAGAVASGAMTPSQAAQAVAAAASAAKAFAPALGPGASPRVATRPPGTAPAGASILSSQSVIKGVPDIALIGGGALLLIAMMGKR
jgi:hypothetical protein